MPKAYVPVKSLADTYQSSQDTNYARDQTTGDLFLKSGINNRCIIPEQFKDATFILQDNTAINADNRVYIVPAGKVFLLLGANLQISTDAAALGNAAYLKIGSAAILRGYGNGDASGCAYGMSQNFASILVIDEATDIRVSTSDPNVRATGCVFGYEIPKSSYFPA